MSLLIAPKTTGLPVVAKAKKEDKGKTRVAGAEPAADEKTKQNKPNKPESAGKSNGKEGKQNNKNKKQQNTQKQQQKQQPEPESSDKKVSGYAAQPDNQADAAKSKESNDKRDSGKEGKGKADANKDEAPKKFVDLRGWMKHFKHAISDADVDVSEAAAEKGWAVMPGPRAVSCHSWSHLARDVATLYVLCQLPAGRTKATVLDWFGSERNKRFDPSKSGPYCTIDGKNSKEVLKITWTSGPDKAIAGDAARSAHGKREPLDPAAIYDLVLIQDVYQDGGRWDLSLTPERILELCERTTTGHAYLICRQFTGWAGADETKNTTDGVWYRDIDETIVFSPDPHSPAYPKHPDFSWLHERHVAGLDVSFLQQFGPFSVYRCAKAAADAQPLGPTVRPDGNINWVTVQPQGWQDWCAEKLGIYRSREEATWLPLWIRNRLPRARFLVHIPTFNQLVNQFGQRVATGINQDSCLMAVKRSFDATREGKGLMSRFPFKYQQILEDTQFAVVNASRDRLSRDLYTFRVNGAEAEKKLLTARSAATPSLPEAVGLKQVLIAIGMLTFIIMKFRRYRLTRGSIVESTLFDVLRRMGYGNPLKVIQSKFWVSMALILNVLGEEFVRNAFPRLAKVMWYVEFALNGMQVGIGALPAFGMHLLCDHLVARYGAAGSVASFGVHALFNLSTVGRTFELAELDKAGRLSEAVPPLALEGVRQYVRTVDSALDSQGKQVQLAVEQGKNLYEAFVRTHATAGRVDAKTFATAIPAAAVIQAYTSTTLRGPKQLRGKIRIAVDGVQCSSPEDALSKLDDCVTQDAANVMYPICVTNGLLWEPARNDKNLLVAILHRTHNDPFVGTDKSSTRHKRWYFLALRSVDYGLFSAQIQTIPTLAQCVEIMGKRGRRIEQAHVATESRGENLQLKTNITLKWNETISAQKDMGDFVTMKPRAIVNLDAIYHAQMTQWARAIADVLHELFDGRIHYVAGVPVRIFFASGYNQDKLNQLGQALAEGEIVIAAAGDDSCVGWGVLTRQGMEPFGEADQGQFDHTQDEGPTFLAAGVWLRALGCPAWFVSLLRECCSIAYKVKTKRMVVKGEAEVQMPTGITLTTVMNSVATVLNKVNYVEWLVSHPDEVPDFTELGRDLGFVVKYHGKPDVGELTFLRGWWRLDTQGAYVWLPLPSALLKLGKILRDPVTITHVHKQGKKVQRTSEEAVKVVAWALARCYDGVPRDYPVLGEFLEVMKRCGKRTKIHIEDVIESAAYKPKLGTVTIDRPEAMLAVCRRYGCDRLDIERAERVLRSVRTLPAYVEDPFFETLANVDYA